MPKQPITIQVDARRIARWQQQADKLGCDLETFIRDAVDTACVEIDGIADRRHVRSGKRSYEPDFKKGKPK